MSDFKTPNLDRLLNQLRMRLPVSETKFQGEAQEDIRAIVADLEARHAEDSKALATLFNAENAALKAKLATMVCGTCKGRKKKLVPVEDSWRRRYVPCPTCQPKGTL